MTPVLSVLIPSGASICSGLILFLLQRLLKQQQKAEEARDRNKATQTALILKSLNALGKLTVANSIALRDGKTNGELKAALTEYETVDKELYAYLISGVRQTNL